MTIENPNSHNFEVERWNVLAALNIIIGIIAVLLNIATLIFISYDWVDWFGIGIWGGCLFISAGSLTIQRSQKLRRISNFAVLLAVILIAFYGYIIDIHDQTYYCSAYSIFFNGTHTVKSSLADESLCDFRLAADITFVVLGCLAAIINVVLVANSRRIRAIPLIPNLNLSPTTPAQQTDNIDLTSLPGSPTATTAADLKRQQDRPAPKLRNVPKEGRMVRNSSYTAL